MLIVALMRATLSAGEIEPGDRSAGQEMASYLDVSVEERVDVGDPALRNVERSGSLEEHGRGCLDG
jgi:hypothetical protein